MSETRPRSEQVNAFPAHCLPFRKPAFRLHFCESDTSEAVLFLG